jgi:hypothetical protein
MPTPIPISSLKGNSSVGSVNQSGPTPISQVKASSSVGSVGQSGPTPISAVKAGLAAPQKSGGGGVGGFLGRFGSDIAHAALNSPGGAYKLAKDATLDVASGISSGGKHRDTTRLSSDAKAMAAATVQDFQHPLRHPGNTALDIAAVASLGAGSVARVGAAGRALDAGEGLGAAAKAVARKPIPAPRVFEANGVSVSRPGSRNVAFRAAQKLLDQARNTFPEKRILGVSQTARVGKELARQRQFDLTRSQMVFNQLAAKGRKVNVKSPKGVALRSAIEGTTPSERIALHKADLAAAKTEYDRKALRGQISAAYKAKQFGREVTHSDGTTTFHITDPKLLALQGEAVAAARKIDEGLVSSGRRAPEVLEAAVQKPGRVFKGAKYVEPTPGKLGKPSSALVRQRAQVARLEQIAARSAERDAAKAKPYPNVHTTPRGVEKAPGPKTPGKASAMPPAPLVSYGTQRLGSALNIAREQLDRMEAAAARRVTPTGLIGAENFAAGQAHIGYPRREPAGSIRRGVALGQGGSVGIPKQEGRLTHTLTGANIHTGHFRNDVPRIIAENGLESERVNALLRARQFFIEHSQATPGDIPTRYAQPIRLDELKNKSYPQAVKDLQQEAAKAEHAGTPNMLGLTYDAIRDRIFPSDIKAEHFDPADIPEHQGVAWIDRRLLGGLERRSPLAGSSDWPVIHGGLKAFDYANNVSRALILYLKPAYGPPQMIGNAALNIIQQGFAAPYNVTRAIGLERAMGTADRVAIDTWMGEGIASNLRVTGQGLTSKVTNALASGWGKVIDSPFRRSSFLHEAAQRGYKTPEQIHALLNDDSKAGNLAEVVHRANDAIINFGDLSEAERTLVRRVLFVYPWLKGSTKYAGHLLTEHPVQSAAIAQIGRQGYEQQQADLGDVPSYYAGLFKVGGTEAVPRTLNPTSAAILQTPFQIAATIAEFATSKHPESAYTASNFLTPSLAAILAGLTGVDSLGRKVPKNIQTVGKQLVEGTPGALLYQRLTKDQTNKTRPLTPHDAIMQALLGSALASAPTNKAKLNSLARRERAGK